VRLGYGTERTRRELPHHFIFDRCYIHGDPALGGKRGLAFNGAWLAVVDSHLSDWKAEGQDTQAVAGWNGPGPFALINNYLEASGENIMFGGADPVIAGLVPADIEIRGNRIAKPAHWNPRDPAYDGSTWSVKNLLELKNARRVLITRNTFEHCWVESQTGHAILFSVHNQNGNSPWSTVEDVTFSHNVVKGAARGLTLSAYDSTSPRGSGRGKRILIRHNVFLDIGTPKSGGVDSDNALFVLLNGGEDVTIDHNTGIHTGNTITAAGEAFIRFTFTNNIASHNEHGIKGDGYSAGNATLKHYFPDAVVQRNVIAGGDSSAYPEDNFYPARITDVGFMETQSDVRLRRTSPYKAAATDGSAIGAHVEGSIDGRAVQGR
jgi:hypothetical protein